MQFIFLDMAGGTLFIREDAERAQWTQEEMTLECEFPYLDDKRISIGQRIYFKDPSTGSEQIYEVKQAVTLEPDHYQSVTAENICISELTDEHIDTKEYTDVLATTPMDELLENTLWRVGEFFVNPVSSGDISRGSVWQGVLQVKENWNVRIEPRVSLSSDGSISRYLDIKPLDGEFNGIRLSVDKNFIDPSVTYDDSEVVTALYGYGGTIVAENKDEEDKEVDFSSVVWESTSTHPAKPAGQKFIADPVATELYGRNGRPRFGFYQNTDITDPETLLQKTWESLVESAKPTISIEGTVADLYRLGYADEPIRLNDVALVEILPVGYKETLQIIKVTTDLLDPSATTVTIGAYIPNIIYIQRETTEQTTGERGGGTNKSKQTERSEYETAIEKNNRKISLRAYQNDLDDLDNELKLQEARIDIEHDRITTEVTDRRNADGVLSSRITQTATEIRSEVTNGINGLNSRITQTATSIRSEVNTAVEGLNSSITQTATQIRSEVNGAIQGVNSSITQQAGRITAEVTRATNAENRLSGRLDVTDSAITAEVTRATNAEGDLSSRITVNADEIELKVSKNGVVSAINQTAESITIDARRININGLISAMESESLTVDALKVYNGFECDSIDASGTVECNDVYCSAVACSALSFGGYDVKWDSLSVRGITSLSDGHFFLYASTSDGRTPTGSESGYLVTGTSTKSIDFLGWDN